MTSDEKIDKILETVLPLGRMVDEHHTTLYGNGQPGLKEDVALMSQRQDDCPARKATTAEGKRTNIALFALIVSIISCLTCVSVAIVTVLR